MIRWGRNNSTLLLTWYSLFHEKENLRKRKSNRFLKSTVKAWAWREGEPSSSKLQRPTERKPPKGNISVSLGLAGPGEGSCFCEAGRTFLARAPPGGTLRMAEDAPRGLTQRLNSAPAGGRRLMNEPQPTDRSGHAGAGKPYGTHKVWLFFFSFFISRWSSHTPSAPHPQIPPQLEFDWRVVAGPPAQGERSKTLMEQLNQSAWKVL